MYWIALKIILLVIGVYWTKEVIGRLPKDIHDLKTRDNTQKGVIIFIWLLTIAFFALVGYQIVSVVISRFGR